MSLALTSVHHPDLLSVERWVYRHGLIQIPWPSMLGRKSSQGAHEVGLHLAPFLLQGPLVHFSSGFKLVIVHQSPELLLREELEDRLASSELGQGVSKLRHAIHPPLLGASSNRLVHRQGELVASPRIPPSVQG